MKGKAAAMSSKAAAAAAWAARGFRVFPILPDVPGAEGNARKAKIPAWEGWTDWASSDPQQVLSWWDTNEFNIGVLTDNMVVVDVDTKAGRDGLASWFDLYGGFDTLTVRTPSGGYHLYYGGANVGLSQGALGRGLDVRSYHGYVLAPGSTIEGVPYVVEIDDPIAQVPQEVLARCKPAFERREERITTPAVAEDGRAIALAVEFINRTKPAIAGELSDALYKLACRVRDYGVSEGMCFTLLEPWGGQCNPPVLGEDLRRRVANAYAYAQNQQGSKHPAVLFAGVNVPPPPALIEETATTEEALARRFTEQESERMRFVAPWGQWFLWNGTCWRKEETLRAYDTARTICRREAEKCRSDAVAAMLARASTVAAVERMARADRQHAATVDQWDADPWLLNTPAGVVDLRSGLRAPHDPADYMTKITAAAPGGESPVWLQFLDRITGGDAELQAFLARIAGYALTGSTQEHALFFLHGTGGNGKGVFLNTLVTVFGDYAKVAPIEAFTASTTDRHPTDMAMLRGARLVTAQETEADRRWAESRIKALTGGDPITARFMRQDFFTYTPAFKLFIAGNHKPGLRTVDDAMRRRMHMIPFAVTIPPAERDPHLMDKLRAEWPGILAWAIGGCLNWRRMGLAPPTAVAEATAAYLAAEDALGLWLAECCDVAPDRYAPSLELFASWSSWATRAGEPVGTAKAFSQALTARGFKSKRQGGTGSSGYLGLQIRLFPTPFQSGG